MDWINLHIPTIIRSPEYVGSSPAERGTWLSVLAYACSIECGGILAGAALWKERQWQQACGVTLDEVSAADRLLKTAGPDIHVNGYPVNMEKQVRRNRKSAKAGAMARWRDAKEKPPGNATSMPGGIATGMPPPHAKGEGEGKGEGGAHSHPAPPDLFDPAPPGQPSAIAIPFWLDVGGKDAARAEEDRAGFRELVVQHPRARRIGEELSRSLQRKVYMRELVAAVLEATGPADANGTTATGAGSRPPAPSLSPQQIAERIVDRDGWEVCRARLPAWCQHPVIDEKTLLDVLSASNDAVAALVAQSKAIA